MLKPYPLLFALICCLISIPAMPADKKPLHLVKGYDPVFDDIIITAFDSEENEAGIITFNTFASMIYQLHIYPDYQKQGIGSLLLNKAIKKMGPEGPDIQLTAFESAIPFYQKHGAIIDENSPEETIEDFSHQLVRARRMLIRRTAL